MNTVNLNELASVIETLMFIVGEPLDTEDVKKVTGATEIEFWQALETLEQKYSKDSGILLKKFGTKIQLCTNPVNAPYVEDLLNPIQKKSLSQAALEVLSIIAYRQPVTRGEIEQIRGVKCDYSVMSLKQKGLIEEVGHKDAIGHPVLFGTTDLFLRHFGLTSLDELPEQENLEVLENSEFEGEEAEQLIIPLMEEKRHTDDEKNSLQED
jgi:segregation and condensation protein B